MIATIIQPLDTAGAIYLVSAVVGFGLGLALLVANAHRFLNIALAATNACVALWSTAAFLSHLPGSSDLIVIYCVRFIGSVPYLLVLCCIAIFHSASRRATARSVIGSTWPWFVYTLSWAWLLCFTGLFVPVQSTRAHPIFGQWAPFARLHLVVLGSFALVYFLRRSRGTTNPGERLVMRVCFFSLSFVVVCALLVACARFFRVTPPLAALSLLFPCYFGFVSYAMASKSLADGRTVMLSAMKHTATVLLLVLWLYHAFRLFTSRGEDLLLFGLLLTAITTWAWFRFSEWALPAVFSAFRRQHLKARRSIVVQLTKALRTPYSSEEVFCSDLRRFLSEWAGTKTLIVFAGIDGGLVEGGVAGLGDTAYGELVLLNATTRASLARFPRSPLVDALYDWLDERGLELIALETEPTEKVSLIVGLGPRDGHDVYSALDQTILREGLAIAASVLSRIRLTRKIADAEHQASVAELSRVLLHEINHPLSAMQSFFDNWSVIRHRPAFVEQYVKRMPSELARLRSLIAALKDARVQSLSTVAVCLPDVLDRCVETMTPIMLEFGVRTEIVAPPAPLFVSADESALLQILINLVRNAIDATAGAAPCDRSIVFTVSASSDGGSVLVDVADRGPGVSPEMRERLFRAFNTSKSSGSGLGLYTSANLARVLGGTLQFVEPEPGSSGATFRLTLVRATPEPPGDAGQIAGSAMVNLAPTP